MVFLISYPQLKLWQNEEYNEGYQTRFEKSVWGKIGTMDYTRYGAAYTCDSRAELCLTTNIHTSMLRVFSKDTFELSVFG